MNDYLYKYNNNNNMFPGRQVFIYTSRHLKILFLINGQSGKWYNLYDQISLLFREMNVF